MRRMCYNRYNNDEKARIVYNQTIIHGRRRTSMTFTWGRIMKTLVVYYSWTGNTKAVAQEIGRQTGGRLLTLTEVKKRKSSGFLCAAIAALFGRKSHLAPMDYSLIGYDHIYLGGPIWASHNTPAVNAFLRYAQLREKNVYLFYTHADDKNPQRALSAITDKVKGRGGRVAGTFFLQTKRKQTLPPDTVRESIANWLKETGEVH